MGGHFVCKFYQGAEDKEFEAQLRKIFGALHREKPESSRSVGLFIPSVVNTHLTNFVRNQKKDFLLL